jgi:hypothetical protein
VRKEAHQPKLKIENGKLKIFDSTPHAAGPIEMAQAQEPEKKETSRIGGRIAHRFQI